MNETARRAPRILVAGVGNVLRGDDGFGVVAARKLMARNDIPEGVTVIETGIGGMSLVQELMAGYDALVLLDACRRGGLPGHVHLLEPEVPEAATLEPSARRDFFADTHYCDPVARARPRCGDRIAAADRPDRRLRGGGRRRLPAWSQPVRGAGHRPRLGDGDLPFEGDSGRGHRHGNGSEMSGG